MFLQLADKEDAASSCSPGEAKGDAPACIRIFGELLLTQGRSSGQVAPLSGTRLLHPGWVLWVPSMKDAPPSATSNLGSFPELTICLLALRTSLSLVKALLGQVLVQLGGVGLSSGMLLQHMAWSSLQLRVGRPCLDEWCGSAERNSARSGKGWYSKDGFRCVRLSPLATETSRHAHRWGHLHHSPMVWRGQSRSSRASFPQEVVCWLCVSSLSFEAHGQGDPTCFHLPQLSIWSCWGGTELSMHAGDLSRLLRAVLLCRVLVPSTDWHQHQFRGPSRSPNCSARCLEDASSAMGAACWRCERGMLSSSPLLRFVPRLTAALRCFKTLSHAGGRRIKACW